MDANIVDLRTLFGKPVSYRIPQFQRPYAWKQEEQWEPLWKDVQHIASQCLDISAKKRPHFMGAIVLQKQDNTINEVERRLVVDGQQRLTTLQLLLSATQAVFQSLDDTERLSRIRALTTNEERFWGAGGQDHATKLRQANVYDHRAFLACMHADTTHEDRYPSDIIKAHGLFLGWISKWINEDPNSRNARSEALEETLTTHLQMAAIDLEEDEQPHIIFETLNARGEPLRQSDLVKNTVMYEAGVTDDREKGDRIWGMFTDPWWREDTKDRLDRIHLDRFLNYWMIVQQVADVTANRVAVEFRAFIDTQQRGDPVPIETIAASMRQAGVVYRDIEKNKIPEIEEALERMAVMEIGVVVPVLLWLYTSDVYSTQRITGVRAIESHLVRRMLCGYPSMGLNLMFIDLIKNLDGQESRAGDFIVEYLHSRTSDSQLWPSDRALKNSLVDGTMRGTIARRKMVLVAIEKYLRGRFAEPLGDVVSLTIEHIMPQSWETHWPLRNHDNDAKEARDISIGAIGNLTLLTKKLNSRQSNGPWSEKREELDKHSTLLLNKQLLQNAPHSWDETTIRERTKELGETIAAIWPHANGFER